MFRVVSYCVEITKSTGWAPRVAARPGGFQQPVAGQRRGDLAPGAALQLADALARDAELTGEGILLPHVAPLGQAAREEHGSLTRTQDLVAQLDHAAAQCGRIEAPYRWRIVARQGQPAHDFVAGQADTRTNPCAKFRIGVRDAFALARPACVLEQARGATQELLLSRRGHGAHRSGATRDVVLNVVTDAADGIFGEPGIGVFGFEPVDRRMQAKLAHADQVGHWQIRTLELPRGGHDQLAMAFPQLRHGCLARLGVRAGPIGSQQATFSVGRHGEAAKQGTDSQ